MVCLTGAIPVSRMVPKYDVAWMHRLGVTYGQKRALNTARAFDKIADWIFVPFFGQ